MFLWITVAAHLSLLGLLAGKPGLTAVILIGYAGYHGLIAWAILSPRSRLFGPNRSRLDTQEPIVSLTFDDGPHPAVTPRLLDLLRERGVRGTFFLIGREVERHPEIVRRIASEGHALGNHTASHSYLFWAHSRVRLRREIASAQEAIEAAAGVRCRQFRAPVGLKNPWLSAELGRMGLELWSWEVRRLDRGRPDPARLLRRLRRRLRPGSILLLHDGADRRPAGNPGVLEALPVLLNALATLGYRCEPLEAERPVAFTAEFSPTEYSLR